MSLEIKENCEKCSTATGPEGEAWICTFECTFCTPCTAAMSHICPNCGGELVRRPRRKTASG